MAQKLRLIDYIFPNISQNRKKAEREKAQRDSREKWKLESEQKKREQGVSVSQSYLEDSIEDLQNADKRTDIKERRLDLYAQRDDFIRALDMSYQARNITGLVTSLDKVYQGDLFAKSFLYQVGNQRREKTAPWLTRDGEPATQVVHTDSRVSFNLRELVSDAQELTELAKKAYRNNESIEAINNPEYRAENIKVADGVYSLLDKTTKYLVNVRGGYIHLSAEEKKALEEVHKLASELKPKSNKKILGLSSVAGFLTGSFLLSPNITGNAISGLTSKNSSILGAVLIIFGIIAGFFWLKSKNKKSKIVIKKKIVREISKKKKY
jgi:hypothetical protein